jgi:hypothetical protein
LLYYEDDSFFAEADRLRADLPATDHCPGRS